MAGSLQFTAGCDLAAFSCLMDEQSQICVLEERVSNLQQEVRNQRAEIDGLKGGLAIVQRELAVLASRVGIYAALGALVGGGIISLIIFGIETWIKGSP